MTLKFLNKGKLFCNNKASTAYIYCKLIKQPIVVSFKFTVTSATPDGARFVFLLNFCSTLLQLSSSVIFPDAVFSSAYSNIPFSLSSCSVCLLLAPSKELPRHCESTIGSFIHRRAHLLILVSLPDNSPPRLRRGKHCTQHLGKFLCRF